MTTSTVRGTYLDRILDNTLAELAERKRSQSLSSLEAAAREGPTPLPFATALRRESTTVIAEVKRASPSKGPIAPDIVAADVAREYVDGGAAAISVLTDSAFFNGSLDDLRSVASVVRESDTPVLRKDFVLDEYQIVEARAAGASAVLLIVAALTDTQLSELLAVASHYGLDALVEVHDEAELGRALGVGALAIGVNNRDLKSFTVDLSTTERIAAVAPGNVTLVGESGIQTKEDVRRLGIAGVHAVLVGESLMRSSDRAAALRDLLS